MKYIRTKDNKIYIVVQVGETTYMTTKGQYIKRFEITKIADTIEELCDEFVLFKEGKPYAIVPNKEHNAELAKDVWKDYRGAIWTDKGLIYAAKINNEGKLELL